VYWLTACWEAMATKQSVYRVCPPRSHEMDGDSAEVGCQGIAVDQCRRRVSELECDALASKADACSRLLQG
jgi:hypothetical protein